MLNNHRLRKNYGDSAFFELQFTELFFRELSTFITHSLTFMQPRGFWVHLFAAKFLQRRVIFDPEFVLHVTEKRKMFTF